MDKVCVTRRLPQAGLDLMARAAELVISPFERPLTRQELLDFSQGCRVVASTMADAMDREFLLARPEVRMVANFAVGFDNLDLEAGRDLGVVMTNTPGVLSDATADLTIGLILALLRRVVEGDKLLRAGGFKGASPMFMLGSDLTDRTLGILGLGRIGEAVAQRALAFGMKIIYHSRSPRPEAERALGAEYVGFDELLARADVISINAPLTPETRGLFNYHIFKRMKPGSYLVNTGRGPIVVEEDLARALSDGLIRGAALDVYEHEPRVHPGLLGLDNVILCPHLGSATEETRGRMSTLVAENVLAFLEGREPPTRLV
ncbi:MAG: D-glycerate dehydrogenase [Pseudomonadota bacterium]